MTDVLAGQDATIVIDAVADTADWVLFDEQGVELGSGTVEAGDITPNTVSVQLAAALLNLPQDTAYAGREIQLSVVKNGAVSTISDFFVVRSMRPLIALQNSFMSYPQALAVRRQFGMTLDGWDATDDDALRQSALIEAYTRLAQLPYRVRTYNASDYAGYGLPNGTGDRRVIISRLDKAGFEALPADFQKAMFRGQLVEADVLLGGDVVAGRRRAGVISETVGESSVTFSERAPMSLPVSTAAYAEIKKYLIFGVGILR